MTDLEKILAAKFISRQDIEISNQVIPIVTEVVRGLVKNFLPEEQDLNDYVLNMAVKANPPSDTTRANLYRNGYNQAIKDFEAALTEKGLL